MVAISSARLGTDSSGWRLQASNLAVSLLYSQEETCLLFCGRSRHVIRQKMIQALVGCFMQPWIVMFGEAVRDEWIAAGVVAFV